MPMDWEKFQKKDEAPPPDLGKMVEDLKRFQKKLPSTYILLVILIIIWALTGFYTVRPDEIGVVKRFGKYKYETQSGLHYHLPYPVETVLKPRVTEVRRFEVGVRIVSPGPPPRYQDVPAEALMLTGDENIVDVQFIVQYLIKNPKDFLFNVDDPAKTIKDASEAAMREVVGNSKIDDALTEGKFRIQQDTKQTLQEILDRYQSGIEVVAVQLQAVAPPEQVVAAFKDVASAREDQNRYINEAEGYANDILPKAQGNAEQMVQQAEAYKAAKIEQARGDASRFLAQLKEYQKAREVTRKRLYLETIQEVLAESKKFVLTQGGASVLPLLPLDGQGIVKPSPRESDR